MKGGDRKLRGDIFVDGSGYNGTNSAMCIIKKQKGRKDEKHLVVTYEDKNVYEIEFLALIKGLELAEENSKIYCDNLQIVNELNLKTIPHSKKFFDTANQIINDKKLSVVKVSREKNPAGIYLEKRLKKLKHEKFLITHPENFLTRKQRKAFKRRRFF